MTKKLDEGAGRILYVIYSVFVLGCFSYIAWAWLLPRGEAMAKSGWLIAGFAVIAALFAFLGFAVPSTLTRAEARAKADGATPETASAYLARNLKLIVIQATFFEAIGAMGLVVFLLCESKAAFGSFLAVAFLFLVSMAPSVAAHADDYRRRARTENMAGQ